MILYQIGDFSLSSLDVIKLFRRDNLKKLVLLHDSESRKRFQGIQKLMMAPKILKSKFTTNYKRDTIYIHTHTHIYTHTSIYILSRKFFSITSSGKKQRNFLSYTIKGF